MKYLKSLWMTLVSFYNLFDKKVEIPSLCQNSLSQVVVHLDILRNSDQTEP